MSFESISDLYHALFAEHQALRDEYRVLHHKYNVDSDKASAQWDAAKAQYDELLQHNERSQAAADAVKAELVTLVNVQAHNAHLSQCNMIMSNRIAFMEQADYNSEQRWMRDVATIRVKNTQIVECLENQLTNVNKNLCDTNKTLLDANNVIHKLQGEITVADKTCQKLRKKLVTTDNKLALYSDAAVHTDDHCWHEMCKKAETRCNTLEKTQNRIVWNLFFAFVYLFSSYMYKQ
mgnify:CR=1 FL=1